MVQWEGDWQNGWPSVDRHGSQGWAGADERSGETGFGRLATCALKCSLKVIRNPVPCHTHLLVANMGCLLLPGRSLLGAPSAPRGPRHDAFGSHPLRSMCKCHLQRML